MRNAFLLSLLFICAVTASAQFRKNTNKTYNLQTFDDKPLSWGFWFGMNRMEYKVQPAATGISDEGRVYLQQDPKFSFSVGLIGRKRLSDDLDLRVEPGLHFSERTLTFGNIVNPVDRERIVKSTYLDIPFFLKYHGWRFDNSRPYVMGGLGYSLNLQSGEDELDDNEQGVFRTKTHNFNWQVEAGLEFYFGRFKMTPAVRGVFFFNNELVADNPDTNPQWAGSLNSVSSRGVFFVLKFE